ncbi:MAG: hypothetical protein Q8R45_10235 [Brevundimonas sp.]|uniref:hypothetical protein n=1 Tax=Brevundimonas sp. TaxID=1871086 RepID=UPI00271E1B4E|nr:hypothetical protein [Brevundimonas sp.]MDO9588073.1 hypothetical protein [Brevundimonas sp.]MDP3368535.1 hypothetical protein [Brevundimonas sp.]MDP3657327.1 hypothetical protein [Brevundimonas sp.]
MRALTSGSAFALSLTACAAVAPPDATPIPQRCDADAARSLIGSHVGAVSFARDANVRVVCTTCPTTKDLRPDRLNVRVWTPRSMQEVFSRF